MSLPLKTGMGRRQRRRAHHTNREPRRRGEARMSARCSYNRRRGNSWAALIVWIVVWMQWVATNARLMTITGVCGRRSSWGVAGKVGRPAEGRRRRRASVVPWQHRAESTTVSGSSAMAPPPDSQWLLLTLQRRFTNRPFHGDRTRPNCVTDCVHAPATRLTSTTKVNPPTEFGSLPIDTYLHASGIHSRANRLMMCRFNT